MWNATVLSLFPEMFPGTLGLSIAGKALKNDIWSLKMVNIRDFSNDKNGKVVRGPAPLSLALAHREEDNGKVILRPWTETDFRTGEAPWWK